MPRPFRSVNLAGGQNIWPDLEMTPVTPSPFLLPSGVPYLVLPPYPSGTPSGDQDPDGTLYWLGTTSDDVVMRHGWMPKSWGVSATVSVAFAADNDPFEFTIEDTFSEEAGAAPDLTTEPGGDYEYTQPIAAPPGGGIIEAASIIGVSIDNSSGWLDSDASALKYRMVLRLGRMIQTMHGRTFGEAEVLIEAELGSIVTVGDDTFFRTARTAAFTPPDYDDGVNCSSIVTSQWRRELVTMTPSGSVTVSEGLGGGSYASATLKSYRPPAPANGIQLTANVSAYWNEVWPARADL